MEQHLLHDHQTLLLPAYKHPRDDEKPSKCVVKISLKCPVTSFCSSPVQKTVLENPDMGQAVCVNKEILNDSIDRGADVVLSLCVHDVFHRSNP